MPGYFQFPILYGNFNVPDQFEPDLNITWGAPGHDRATCRGAFRRFACRTDRSIARRAPPATTCSAAIGCQPTRRRLLLRRNGRAHRATAETGQDRGADADPQRVSVSEFIRSTDPLFRPVDMTTAPDGTMYITDMYRGIIQEAQWTGRGTYLREEDRTVSARQGDAPRTHLAADVRGHGARQTQPRMLNETPAQLVAHLSIRTAGGATPRSSCSC